MKKPSILPASNEVASEKISNTATITFAMKRKTVASSNVLVSEIITQSGKASAAKKRTAPVRMKLITCLILSTLSI
jgi:hypothetical protein